MAEHSVTDYSRPHPRFGKKVTNRQWLKGRLKNPTGFCSSYQPLYAQGHEGTRPMVNGKPMRVCDHYLSCPCMCHYEVDQMFESAGIDRPPAQQSPEYMAMLGISHAKTDKMIADIYTDRYGNHALSSDAGTSVTPTHEGTVATPERGAYDAPAGPDAAMFAPTPTGRRARGQLEFHVLKVCREFAQGVYVWDECLPKLVAEAIAKSEQSEPPSTGAIDAVWDRWQKIGFAERAKKPSRFVKFTGGHSDADLEILKGKAKREKRRAVTEQRRGTLRPKR